MTEKNKEWTEIGPAETIVKFELQEVDSTKTFEIFKYADALRIVGRQNEAIQKYEELASLPISEAKGSLVALYKGQTFFEMGRFSDAEIALRESCCHDKSTVPRVYLASCLASQQRFEEAIDVLNDALNFEGDHDEVYLNLALSQRALGQLEAAKTNLELALTVTQDYPHASKTLEDINAALSILEKSSRPTG